MAQKIAVSSSALLEKKPKMIMNEVLTLDHVLVASLWNKKSQVGPTPTRPSGGFGERGPQAL